MQKNVSLKKASAWVICRVDTVGGDTVLIFQKQNKDLLYTPCLFLHVRFQNSWKKRQKCKKKGKGGVKHCFEKIKTIGFIVFYCLVVTFTSQPRMHAVCIASTPGV